MKCIAIDVTSRWAVLNGIVLDMEIKSVTCCFRCASVVVWLAVFQFAFALPARAVWQDGNSLYEMCGNDAKVWAMLYFEGVVDGYEFAEKDDFCVPEGAKASQLRDLVCNYIRDNPAERHLAGSLMVLFALKRAWPCQSR